MSSYSWHLTSRRGTALRAARTVPNRPSGTGKEQQGGAIQYSVELFSLDLGGHCNVSSIHAKLMLYQAYGQFILALHRCYLRYSLSLDHHAQAISDSEGSGETCIQRVEGLFEESKLVL